MKRGPVGIYMGDAPVCLQQVIANVDWIRGRGGDVTDSALRVITRELIAGGKLQDPKSVSLVPHELVQSRTPLVLRSLGDSLLDILHRWSVYKSGKLSACAALTLYMRMIENPSFFEVIGQNAVFYLTEVMVDPLATRCGMLVTPTGVNQKLILDTWNVTSPIYPYREAMWIVGDYEE